MLIRDLPVFGKPVYLQVPRRQFQCEHCQQFHSEVLEFMSGRHAYTPRYAQAIYEQVKQSSLEEVSRREGLGIATVRQIFDAQAVHTIKKLSHCRNV
ncbi:transposase family protein [Phormidesmis sp. 146-20]